MSHVLSQSDLSNMLAEAARQVTVGAVYEHYKKQRYKITGLAISESTDEVVVIYEGQYGNKLTFVRPLKDWLEKMEYDGKQISRFTKLDS